MLIWRLTSCNVYMGTYDIDTLLPSLVRWDVLITSTYCVLVLTIASTASYSYTKNNLLYIVDIIILRGTQKRSKIDLAMSFDNTEYFDTSRALWCFKRISNKDNKHPFCAMWQ